MPDPIIPLPIDSRYKDTPKLFDVEGNVFMDLWVEPGEIAADRDSTLRHIPIPSEVGRLDLLADTYYSNVVPWWVIASANGLRDQVEDMQELVSQENNRKMLVLPRAVAVQAFLTRR